MKSMHSQTILTATSVLKDMKKVNIIDDWRWYPSISKWVIKCQLHIVSANPDLVPNATNWYMMIDEDYPNGDVDFVPAKDNGITATFQHQFYNKLGKKETPWREGKICSKTDLFYLRKRAYDFEPFEPHERLKWHINRTLNWLYDASKGTLVDSGDPFELPDYDTTYSCFSLVHFESPQTLSIWTDRIGQAGIVRLGIMREPKGTLIVLSFNDNENKIILNSNWNNYIKSQVTRLIIGTWALLPKTIALRPWQAPMTWNELDKFIIEQGFDHRRLLAKLMWPFTWNSLHFMLLGFPIPEKCGSKNHQVHWQAIRFPMIGNIEADEHNKLHWQKSENWHSNEIHNRGMFGKNVTEDKILVIGAGAMGSMVSEMLVRGGVEKLTIIDDERIEIGNLTRHNLSLKDIGKFKAMALADHLSKLSPHAHVDVINKKFEKIEDSKSDYLRGHSIIIDATGNDDILFYLENFRWAELSVFCSISIGLRASRLYVLIARKTKFPRAFFMCHVERWLKKDTIEDDGSTLPRSGGIGCWHPAFPARVDDMWLFSSVALKYIEDHLRKNIKGATLGVFEKVIDNNSFIGIRLISEHHDNG
jgi:hypothetical protein